VLLGIQLPPDERSRFAAYLSELGYPHWEETANPAYRLFAGTGKEE
jgi:threonine dehydratase